MWLAGKEMKSLKHPDTKNSTQDILDKLCKCKLTNSHSIEYLHPPIDGLWILSPQTVADPGFFLGEGAPLRNGVTDRWGKQILKANTKKMVSSQGGWGAHSLHPSPGSAPVRKVKCRHIPPIRGLKDQRCQHSSPSETAFKAGFH